MKRYVLIFILTVLALGGLFAFLRRSDKKTPVNTTYRGSYVAMGDSVAAGVGLEGDSDTSACDRTDQSYPNQVAAALHYKLSNLSCSGATLDTGILGQQDVNGLWVTPQLDALFAMPKPDLVTITIGANDAHWTDILSKCYVSTCGSSEDTLVTQTNLATLNNNLVTLLTRLQSHYVAGKTPRVLVTGYYQIFPESAGKNCTDLSGIDNTELGWGRQFQDNLNTTIQTTVGTSAFATFVPINFNGHELCSVDPWIQSLGSSRPYHPTADGQTNIKKQIVNKLQQGR